MKRKYANISLIVISILLFIGTIAICFYGEYSNRRSYKSNMTNAEEVQLDMSNNAV